MNKQYDNFIKILNTALTEKTAELEDADFQELSELAFQQDIAPIFLEGAVKYPEFAAAPLSVKAHLIDASTKAVVNQTQNTAEFCSIFKAAFGRTQTYRFERADLPQGLRKA